MERNQRVGIVPYNGGVFPEEILMEILSRIPPKPLTALKLVHPGWRDIIESRYFISSKHMVQMKLQNRVGFLLQSQYGYYPLGYSKSENGGPNQREIMDGDPEIALLASCNGLVTCCNLFDQFYVFNPSTGDESLNIPTTQIDFPNECVGASVIFGLGYDSIADEYKLVKIALFNAFNLVTEVKVLSLRTMEWRRVGDLPFNNIVCKPGVFVGGCLNWQVTRSHMLVGIGTFCIRTETYDFIELPPAMGGAKYYGELAALDDDHLAMYSSICASLDDFEMWIMYEYRNPASWRRIRFEPVVPIMANERVLSPQPLRLVKPDNVRILIRMEPMGYFMEYDTITGAYYHVGGENMENEYNTIFPYTQSVVLPRLLRD